MKTFLTLVPELLCLTGVVVLAATRLVAFAGRRASGASLRFPPRQLAPIDRVNILSLIAGAALLLATLLFAVPARAQNAPASPRDGIDVERYRFALTLSDDSDRIEGGARVRVRFLADTVRTFALDLIGKDDGGDGTGMTVESVQRDGEDVPYEHENDRLRINAEAPKKGDQRTYRIEYAGVPANGLIIAKNRYGDRTFFGDNWPNRARHWLPTVDHPSDKAPVAFRVTAPDAYQVISNGRLRERTDLPGPATLTRWQSTEPLPTKVMVIGAARFAVEYVDTVDGVPVQSWVFPQNRKTAFREMARAERILKFYEDRIANYPYVKLANVQSKTRYGGMENASAIFYSEDALADDESDEALVAHEVAHQWYGDSVTETAWPHLWLSEGFATYLTDLYFLDQYGPERFEKRMRAERKGAVRATNELPDTPLVDTTFADPNELLTGLPYVKGAWVLHMLRARAGAETFWEGLRSYYRKHASGNASTSDFRAAMEAASGQDLEHFFEQWTRRPGLPRYEGTWSYDAGAGEVRVTLRQTQDEPVFEHPLEVGVYAESENADPHIETVQIDEREETFALEAPSERPAAVRLDPRVRVLMAASFKAEQ